MVNCESGKKFVPGQVFGSKTGPRFVPGKILLSPSGASTFIPGQVLYSSDRGSVFVPGNIVDTNSGEIRILKNMILNDCLYTDVFICFCYLKHKYFLVFLTHKIKWK
jgi:hypothetical protein